MKKAHQQLLSLSLSNFILLVSLISVVDSNNPNRGCKTDQSLRVNFFNHAHLIIPHPSKIEKGGEDAQYSSEKLLVVADGVGGWANVY